MKSNNNVQCQGSVPAKSTIKPETESTTDTRIVIDYVDAKRLSMMLVVRTGEDDFVQGSPLQLLKNKPRWLKQLRQVDIDRLDLLAKTEKLWNQERIAKNIKIPAEQPGIPKRWWFVSATAYERALEQFAHMG